MKFVEEFKEFINKGNAMDMAVGVIIGGAFTAIVTSLTDDIINPFIQLVTSAAGADGADAASCLVIPVTADVSINFSAFISAIINFLIIALVVFCLVKALKSMQNAGASVMGRNKPAEPEYNAPTCPFCLEEVKEGATRCPHCAGAFEKPAEKTLKA